MALPAGMLTATLTFGSSLTFTGEDVAMVVTVKPTHSLVWAATGQPLVSFAHNMTIEAGTVGQVTVPVVDQAGFINDAGQPFTMWAYTVTVQYKRGLTVLPAALRVVQPLIGQDVIDVDLLPSGSITTPVVGTVPTVTSVNGQTGAVTVTADAFVELDTDGVPYLTQI